MVKCDFRFPPVVHWNLFRISSFGFRILTTVQRRAWTELKFCGQLSLVANVKQFCKAYSYPPMRNVVLSCVHCLAIGREGSIPSQPRAFEPRRLSRAFRRLNPTRRSV